MADKIKNISQHKESLPGESGRREGKGISEKDEKEIVEKSREFVEGVSEVVQGAETVETAGEVSEEMSEGKKKASGGGSGKNQQDQDVGIKATMPPSIEIMRIQVSTQIKNEIRMLEKEAARLMSSPGGFQPFKLNTVVAKIRELRDILSSLAYATADALKGLWLKFVKGIIP